MPKGSSYIGTRFAIAMVFGLLDFQVLGTRAESLALHDTSYFAPTENGIAALDVQRESSAVWQVVAYDSDFETYHTATAFAVTEHLLATNGHVVESLAQVFREGGSARVVQHESGLALDVTSMWIHPGYATESEINPDVGFIQVDETLGQWLRLANSETLNSLGVFDVVRMYGFPGDVAASIDFAHSAPVPLRPRVTAALGRITALRPLSIFSASADHSLVIQHDLRSVGGSSGSPLINEKGRVIGINARGGSEIDPGVAFAIRSDVLRGLLEMVEIGVIKPVDILEHRDFEALANNQDWEGSIIATMDVIAESVDNWPAACIICVGLVSITMLGAARRKTRLHRQLLSSASRFVEVSEQRLRAIETNMK